MSSEKIAAILTRPQSINVLWDKVASLALRKQCDSLCASEGILKNFANIIQYKTQQNKTKCKPGAHIFHCTISHIC